MITPQKRKKIEQDLKEVRHFTSLTRSLTPDILKACKHLGTLERHVQDLLNSVSLQEDTNPPGEDQTETPAKACPDPSPDG